MLIALTVFELLFLGILLIPLVFILSSPIWMYFYQKNRDVFFGDVAQKYNLEFRGNHTLLNTWSQNDLNKQLALRSCVGVINKKNIIVGDFYYSTWLLRFTKASLMPIKFQIPIRGIYGIKTIMIVNNKEEDIGSSFTGIASKEKIQRLLNALTKK